ncbi:gas vesicle protein GvpG [Sporohalobacter salinus]|uniref:gas vesicle protein GvpG n=1 Tax=Sporohalobacter salinus TaxID=1494606 RepID=UPI0019616C33|nr:gas vesicle protein GvpG [Sporohalobacter salinus]MBM7623257.1 putative membrane protein [Sporohalobacter salinus]
MFGINSIIKVIKIVYDQAKEEYLNEDKVREQLLNLNLKYERGDINQEEYRAQEKKLMQRIKDIREYKRGFREEGGREE